MKMDVRHYPYRKQKQWVVYWKSVWTGKRHHRGFSSEESAREFIDAMTDVEKKEREALRRRQKQTAYPQLRECPAYTLLYKFSPKDTGQSKVK